MQNDQAKTIPWKAQAGKVNLPLFLLFLHTLETGVNRGTGLTLMLSVGAQGHLRQFRNTVHYKRDTKFFFSVTSGHWKCELRNMTKASTGGRSQLPMSLEYILPCPNLTVPTCLIIQRFPKIIILEVKLDINKTKKKGGVGGQRKQIENLHGPILNWNVQMLLTTVALPCLCQGTILTRMIRPWEVPSTPFTLRKGLSFPKIQILQPVPP